MSDFNITLFEACELLNRSKKSISRYIRRGLLHPEKVKSQQGTLEYRFSKADLEAFKQEQSRQDTQDRADRTEETRETGHSKTENTLNSVETVETRQNTPDQTGHLRANRTGQTGQENEVITLLRETTGLLKDQLKVKDEQIKDLGGKIDQLIERDRETNIILKGLQDKVFMLGTGKPELIEPINASSQEVTDQTGQGDTQEAKPETIEMIQDTADGTGQDEIKPKKNTDKTKKQEKKGIVKWLFG